MCLRDRPIVLAEDGSYQYKEDSESAIQTLQEALSLAEYATAEECMAELAQQYDCQGYSKEDMRNVASVRYSMTQDGFSRTSPYVIAEDVSAETVGVISERSEEWPGIEIRVAVTRYYGAVSYTHLDVYKRQGLPCSRHCGCRSRRYTFEKCR